ncbi:MAG: MFS transporter [Chloroflexia bacterium]
MPETHALRTLDCDGRLLFTTRAVRMFAYGALSVVLALYLAQLGLSSEQIGLLITATLVGDAVISLLIAGTADRVGRKKMLLLGAGLMIFAGAVFALTNNIVFLAAAAIIGTISPSDKEVGPFLSIEQAILPQTAPDRSRTAIFAWYNLAGSFATALGALCSGALVGLLQAKGVVPLESYRVVLIGYTLLGVVLALRFLNLSPQAEVRLATQAATPPTSGQRLAGGVAEPARPGAPAARSGFFGLHRSRGVVLHLSSLFMLDAFAGGLVVQSLIAYWFHLQYGVEPALLGVIFFGANILAGFSALAAARIAARFGLINTMVWTHIPSNILLILVPFMPSLPLAIAVLLARFSISQMDVPTRQSYTMAVVDPDERSAAAGITTVARTAASSISPVLSGALIGMSFLAAPFVLAGGLKIVYDLALYRSFRAVRPPEEKEDSPHREVTCHESEG